MFDKVTLGAASLVLVDTGVFVDGWTVGKGVIGKMGEGGKGIVTVDEGCASRVLSVHPERKITNKINMTSLDEINGIKRPFVIR